MKWNIRVADPAGNITILVKTPVKKEEYAVVAGELLSVVDDAEQVGFLVPSIYGGDVRLEMMGGEFCGNALRGAALCYAAENGISDETEIMAEISGVKYPLSVLTDVGNNTSTARMPLPNEISPISFRGSTATAVLFDGIVHFVITEPLKDISAGKIKDYLRLAAEDYDVAAAGLMFYDAQAKSLKPAVYVVATDTLFYENSCASGSGAVVVTQVMHERDGVFLLKLKEPGGLIEAMVEKKDNQIISLQIGGEITLSSERTVEI
jgi:diaminopimelate epimerase